MRPEQSSKKPMNAPEENEGAVAVAGKFDEEQLRNMKYNDFKKFAASLGVDCKGTRDEIMARSPRPLPLSEFDAVDVASSL